MPKASDISGQRFNSLVAIRPTKDRSGNGGIIWVCICDCGKEIMCTVDDLRGSRKSSCGCSSKYRIWDRNVVGLTFNRLTVTSRSKTLNSQIYWLCRCICGNEVEVRHGNLISGNTRSCGCAKLASVRTHGKSKTPEWNTWVYMKQRCLNPKDPSFRYYGGRGIIIHPPWIESFTEFLAYVGQKPGPEYSLDRIDPDKSYVPGNVRWATPVQQFENRKFRGMTFSFYQYETHKTAVYPSSTQLDSVIYCALGAASESAEIAGKVKKVLRDRNGDLDSDSKKDIISEMGDTLWYLSEMASVLNVRLDTVAASNLAKLRSRTERGTLHGSGDNR